MSPADRSAHHASRRRLRLPSVALVVALATGLAPALHAASPQLDVDAMTFVASKGQLNELVLNATDTVRSFTRHFDGLIRAAEINAHEAVDFVRRLTG